MADKKAASPFLWQGLIAVAWPGNRCYESHQVNAYPSIDGTDKPSFSKFFHLNYNSAMNFREIMLWKFDRIGNFYFLAIIGSLILVLGYLHSLSGLTYEFHVFFLIPILVLSRAPMEPFESRLNGAT
ncbi:hypothetical protein, partial [Propionivibrio sp.]|uniref:hypothetical protein n=1 Tax=Propionivibrio sp. TaxID=2212460 RepID=UPI003BF0CEAA